MLGGGVGTVREGVPLPFMGKARPVLALRLPLSCRDQALGRPQLSLAAKVIAMRFPTEFLIDESGAVTVDWVVLAAAVVGLGVGTVGAVRSGALSMGNDISTSLSNAAVASLGTLGAVPVVTPTMGAMLRESMWETAGGRCMPGPGCPPPTQYYEQQFEMSDGTIWTRSYEVVNDQVTVWSWTDADGNTVEGESPCSRSLPCAS